MKFTKMHGLGNDYVYVNCFEENIEDPSALAIELSDRHFGIGGDGLILICPSDIADAKMRMFNADGSESQMCGNGLRCVSKYTFDHKLAEPGTTFSIPGQPSFPHSLNIETGNGILKVGIMPGEDGMAEQICVNMGQPVLNGPDIPVAIESNPVVDVEFGTDDFASPMTCVSMGNPHVVFFCDDVEGLDLDKIGPAIENHPLFPERINAHFVKVLAPDEFVMRTWERGSGITLACGTGACACCVAAVLNGKCQRAVLAHLPGGDLTLNWCQEDNCVYMTGPATEVFTGHI
ncbi:MAG: diaminopimelate epimerase [Sedimentisphaeraceae bacterium JB056]